MATTTAPPPEQSEMEPVLPESRILPPPPLGRPPASISSLGVNMPGAKGTHFTGPVVSGPTPGRPEGVQGSALLSANFKIDYSMGNFSFPLQFPQGSFLYAGYAITYQAFTAAPTVTIGMQPGGTDISVTIPAVNTSQLVTLDVPLPLWNAVPPKVPFRCWLNVTGNTGTAGGTILSLIYIVLAQAWS